MESRQLSATVVFAVIAAVLVAVPALGVGVGPPAQVENNSTAENGTVGQQVSAFMQTTAVDANATTDSGMWQAAVNDTDDPDGEVTDRTEELERRLDSIEAQMARLEEQRGDIPEVAYTARASALNERLESLRSQINETEQTADRVGANVSKLQNLKTRAGNTTGPEVASVARNITDPPRGPPEDRGPSGERGPGSDGPPDDNPNGDTDAGPPDDTGSDDGSDTGNESDAGPPDDTGSSDDTDAGNEPDTGPSDDTGPNNGTDAGNETEDDTGPPDDSPGGDNNALESRLVEPL